MSKRTLFLGIATAVFFLLIGIPAQAEQSDLDLAGLWGRNDGHRVRFEGSGENYSGYIVTLTELQRECHFSVGEQSFRLTRTSYNSFQGEIKWRSGDGSQEWRPVTMTITATTMTESSTGSWTRISGPPDSGEDDKDDDDTTDDDISQGDPECPPFEYFVDGRCQHIFELCGRDSILMYDKAKRKCYCPDPYVYQDRRCIHEDDLNPDESVFDFCLPPEGSGVGLSHPLLPVAQAQIYSNYSIITSIEGEVLVKTKNADRWAPAFLGQRLMLGDKVKTTREGRCEVKFANSAVFRMRPLSQMEIPDQKQTECRVNQKVGFLDMYFGKVWKNVDTGKPNFRICTPNTCTGRRDTAGPPLEGKIKQSEGTIAFKDYLQDLNLILGASPAMAKGGETTLHSSYDEDTQITRFYVEEGEVEIFDPDETAAVVLSAGEQITVGSGEVPEAQNILPKSQVSEKWWEDDWGEGIGRYVYTIGGAIGGAAVILLVVLILIVRKRRAN